MFTHIPTDADERAIDAIMADPTVVSARVAAYNINYHRLTIVEITRLDGSEDTVQLDGEGNELR